MGEAAGRGCPRLKTGFDLHITIHTTLYTIYVYTLRIHTYIHKMADSQKKTNGERKR